MTETEQLKKNADDALVKQRYREVSAYLDVLLKRMEHCVKWSMISSLAYMGAWVAWVILDLAFPWGKGWWFIIWVAGLIWQQIWDVRLASVRGKLDGAFKVLELLGLVPPASEGDSRKKKKRFWEEARQIVKEWASKKKAAQDKAYAPA